MHHYHTHQLGEKKLTVVEMSIKEKKLGNPLMQLRLVCNSPHNFYNPWSFDENVPVDESIVTSSGKMLLLDRLLPTMFERGHKVLIFTQFKTQLDILHDYCAELRGWNVCRIDGSVGKHIEFLSVLFGVTSSITLKISAGDRLCVTYYFISNLISLMLPSKAFLPVV